MIRRGKNRLVHRILLYSMALLLVLAGGTPFPSFAYAAEGDPVLLYEFKTEDPQTGLKAGSRAAVTVEMSRADGLEEAYRLYGVQLDIGYDNELFEVSELKNAGLRRPDGENWKGSWSCSSIADVNGKKQVRVLCTNLGLMGGLENADVVPSGRTAIGSFVLTVKKDVPGESATVSFAKVLSIGSDLKKTASLGGAALELTFAAAGSSGAGTGSDETADGTGNGSGSADSGSGSGAASGGSDSGTGAGSGANSGSSSSGGSGGGLGNAGAHDGADGSRAETKTKVSFEELVDIPKDHWAAAYIRSIVESGIASGNERKEFLPDRSVTRAEFCQMAAAAFGYEAAAADGRFRDVTQADWYCGAVTALAEAGIVSGTGDGSFGAEQTLTRQDMAVILDRIETDRNINKPVVREYAAFGDEAQIEEYAKQAVLELYCTGIMSGTDEGDFEPEQDSTRAQVAVVLTKLMNKEEGR